MAADTEFDGWETYGLSRPNSSNGWSLSVTDDEATRIRTNPTNYEYALSFKVDIASCRITDDTSMTENSLGENMSTYRSEETFLDCIKVCFPSIIEF